MKHIRTSAIIILIHLFALECFYSAPGYGQENAITQEQFLKEAPKRWLEYLHQLDNKEARVQRLVTFNDGSETIREDYTFQFSYPCLSTFFQDHYIENYCNRLVCSNHQYEFELTRNEETQEWSIDRYAPLKGDALTVGSRRSTKDWRFPLVFPRQDVPRDSISEVVVADLAPGLWFAGTTCSLINFFIDDKVKILDFKDVSSQYGNIPAVRVSFEYQLKALYDGLDDYHVKLTKEAVQDDPKRAETWKPLHITGNVLFISKYYLASEGSFQYEYGDETSKNNIKVEYINADEFPLPVKHTYKGKVKRSDRSYEHVGDVTLDVRDRPDKTEEPFYLSGYGFPEPEFQDETIWNRITLCGIGLVLLTVGMWIALTRFKNTKQEEST